MRSGPKVQTCANLVDLFKSFQTSISLQNLALIQPRKGLSKFANILPNFQIRIMELMEA